MNGKKATIDDIAREANVSKSTVSRVLNDTTPVHEEKRKAVLAAVEQLNFEPNLFARSLAGGQSKTIGVLTQNIGSPFYDSIVQGILDELTGSSWSPIFADGQWQTETGHAALETLIGRKVDGLILVGGSWAKEEFESLRERVPTIVVGRELDGWDDQWISVDNEQAAFDATRFLIELGHRRIAHVGGIRDHQDAIRRREGYCRALTEANIEIDEELICEGNFDGNSGVVAIESLLMRGKSFSAIFAANDMTAFGARLALHRKGIRVPDDVSIVGFDDQAEAAFMTPPLTTVHQPAMEMGGVAAAAIVKLINGQEYELPEMPSRIVVRESTQKRT